MEYYTISKSVKTYKTSKTSLTRLANKNITTKHIRKENGVFLVSLELLESKYQKRLSSPTKESRTRANHHTEHVRTTEPKSKGVGAFAPVQTMHQSEPKTENSNELVTILKTQNEFLQSQIVKKDSQIDKLLERQFEQNTIIQTLQNRFDGIGKQIDTSTLLLSEKVSQKKEVAPVTNNDNSNFGFTVAAAVMILLLVLAIVVFLTVK